MKKLMVIVALLMIVALPARAWALPLDVFKCQWTVEVEPLGDAKISLKFNYDALTYLIWQRKYGQNPSLLKRDLGKLLMPYELADRSFRVDDSNKMDREIVVSLVAKGYMHCKADDVWQTEFPRKYSCDERVDNTYRLHGSSELVGGRIMEESVRLILPKAATQFTDRTDRTNGNTVIQYKLAMGDPAVNPAAAAGAAAPGAAAAGSFGIEKVWWFVGAGVAGFLGLVFLIVGIAVRGKLKAA